jgi:hypothetical protein
MISAARARAIITSTREAVISNTLREALMRLNPVITEARMDGAFPPVLASFVLWSAFSIFGMKYLHH